jgi:serine/threonine-protein kinase HipA
LTQAIKIYLYEHTLGFLAQDNGKYVFKYDEEFQKTGMQPAPLYMDTKRATHSFPLLNDTSFAGLPGLISDSIPDYYGTQVIQKYYSSIGADPLSITPLDKLAYIGERGFGALRFAPAQNLTSGVRDPNIELFTLWDESRKVLSNDGPSKEISWVYSFGGTAGGARAKADILFNRESGLFSIREEATRNGYSHWLLKFDGLAKEDKGQPQPYERMEYIYSLLASDAGIDVPETSYVEESSGMFHFLVKRFDRSVDAKTQETTRRHVQTISALLHNDHNNQQSLDYVDVLTTIKRLTGSAGETLRAYRQMIFNVLAHNYDDHSKNLSLMMDTNGAWSLSPTYDNVYTNSKGWFENGHQITANQKSKLITKADVLAVADRLDISGSKARTIITDVQSALIGWDDYAKKYGLTDRFPDYVKEVQAGLGRVQF